MGKKTTRKFLSFCIGISFFLPIFEWHSFEMSGLNFILSSHTESYKYLLLLVPVPAFLLLTEMQNEHVMLFSAKALSVLPLIGIVLTLISMYIDERSELFFYGNGNVFSIVNIGFWSVMIFSSLLALVCFQKKADKQFA